MLTWQEQFVKGNVELGTKWSTRSGVFSIFSEPSARIGLPWVNWLSADNIVGVSLIDHAIPRPARDLSVSILWAFLVQLNDHTVDDIAFHPFMSQAGAEPINATVTGYRLFRNAANLRLHRRDAGAFVSIIDMDAFNIADNNKHLFVISREVSGVNRFWRVYLDPPINNLLNPANLIGGPVSDAVHATATHLWIRSQDPRVIFTGIYLES